MLAGREAFGKSVGKLSNSGRERFGPCLRIEAREAATHDIEQLPFLE
jgi:hypothetical protein